MNDHQPGVSLASVDELRQLSAAFKIVYVYIYDGTPDPLIKELFAAILPEETLLMLDAQMDRGFLRNTSITVDITLDRQFISKRLVDLRGLGAWSKGVFTVFETDSDRFAMVMEKSRSFALGSRQ